MTPRFRITGRDYTTRPDQRPVPDGSIYARDLIRSRGPWEFARTVATCLAGVVVAWLLMVAF